jgi:hypothetical protein
MKRHLRRSPLRDRALSQVRQNLEELMHRFAEIETISEANCRVLDLQFKRIAAMQAEVDQLLAQRKREAR